MFWYIGNALDFGPRDPWFESGSLQQFISSFFFLFWLFNDHKIENRPPNSSPWRIKCLVFISSVHFFVHTFTRNQHGQLPSNFCQSSSPMISSQISFFKVTRSSWRHPGAILWNHVIHHIFMMHKQRSFIFISHILQVKGQQVMSSKVTWRSWRARTRASKF